MWVEGVARTTAAICQASEQPRQASHVLAQQMASRSWGGYPTNGHGLTGADAAVTRATGAATKM
ncbi:hypothetical protein [Candidatus Amarobacter glycogenicus]|uniref:hypothetical protein n=1 Tax=Candidatus Amarobacter glycogenicus TaxID=3140699 RepID=UPI002A0ABA10|nr:hypothetical protein [Dehalococcoidia bacterium]